MSIITSAERVGIKKGKIEGLHESIYAILRSNLERIFVNFLPRYNKFRTLKYYRKFGLD